MYFLSKIFFVINGLTAFLFSCDNVYKISDIEKKKPTLVK